MSPKKTAAAAKAAAAAAPALPDSPPDLLQEETASVPGDVPPADPQEDRRLPEVEVVQVPQPAPGPSWKRPRVSKRAFCD